MTSPAAMLTFDAPATAAQAALLTPALQALLLRLHQRFEPERQRLLAERRARQARCRWRSSSRDAGRSWSRLMRASLRSRDARQAGLQTRCVVVVVGPGRNHPRHSVQRWRRWCSTVIPK